MGLSEEEMSHNPFWLPRKLSKGKKIKILNQGTTRGWFHLGRKKQGK